MRRKEKQVAELGEIEALLQRAQVCRIGMCDKGRPYVVPVLFGYRDNAVYFHSAREGMKIELIRSNPRVCFEVDLDVEFVKADSVCAWGLRYGSVIGFGTASIVDEPAGKREAYDVIVGHYTDGPFEYREPPLARTVVVRIDVESMTGKRSGS